LLRKKMWQKQAGGICLNEHCKILQNPHKHVSFCNTFSTFSESKLVLS
jgi:hypothetical protein